jgi:hydrogenase-4 component E
MNFAMDFTTHFDPIAAARLLDTCSAGVVVVGVLIAGSRSIGRAIWLVAAQAALLAVAAIAIGLATNAGHMILGGLLTFATRGVAVPLILGRVLRRSPVRVERNPYLGPRASLVAAIAIVFAVSVAIDSSTLSGTFDAPRALPASVAEVLTGLLIAMTRRKGLSIVVGLLVFENGLALTAFSLTYGMPLVVEMGAAFDLMLVIVAVGVYARRMLTVFGSLSTDQLRNLRG